MSNQQNISVVGTVATEPRLVVTQAGVKLCTFRLASGERRYDRGQQKWVDGDTNWFSVAAFRALAEHAGQSFKKGERVIVTGRLRVRQWETEEKSGTSVEIEADALGHDLRWGVSRFEKTYAPENPASEGSGGDAVASQGSSWTTSAALGAEQAASGAADGERDESAGSDGERSHDDGSAVGGGERVPIAA